MKITGVQAVDNRFPLPTGAGSDARHTDPVYSFATCLLEVDGMPAGTGIALTLGRGNELVTEAIRSYAPFIVGRDFDNVVGQLGATWHEWANESQLRWVGPHKGVTHLALASVMGAIVDAWARTKDQPLWRLLLGLTPEEVVDLIDVTGIEDTLTRRRAVELLQERRLPDSAIADLVRDGYPAYDTSVGWLGYSLDELVANVTEATQKGFRAVKVKIGSDDDVRRVAAVREVIGADIDLMVDANQSYGVADAIAVGRALARFDPYWFEEPVHPDDLLGYRAVKDALQPMRIVGGEHLANQVLFKNAIAIGAVDVVQADAVRLAGLPEFLAVALLASGASLPVAPHVGDMGQLHQHLVPFLRVALGMPLIPLEHIPHVAHHFAEPCVIEAGHYRLPETPGAGTALLVA
jgi:L-fuconate dehydratase